MTAYVLDDVVYVWVFGRLVVRRDLATGVELLFPPVAPVKSGRLMLYSSVEVFLNGVRLN